MSIISVTKIGDCKMMMRTKGRVIWSFLLGIVCVILGGAPFLNKSFPPPLDQAFNPMITKIVLLLGGILLLYDGFQLRNPMTGLPNYTSMFAGIVLAAVGAIPLLIDLGWVNKVLPFIATLSISPEILQGLLVFFGLYLVYDAYVMSKQFY